MRDFERWTYHLFTLASGKKAFKHGIAALNLATGKVEPGAAAALLVIGVFDQSVDATGGDKPVNVNLCTEIEVEWWANDGGIAAANVGSLAYAVDDNTVTKTANACCVGRIWAVSTTRGVAVQKLPMAPTPASMEATADEAPTPPPSASSEPARKPLGGKV